MLILGCELLACPSTRRVLLWRPLDTARTELWGTWQGEHVKTDGTDLEAAFQEESAHMWLI